ncbi:hypothetical protein [Fontibacillus sp. BL9]|uniref:hypothetical protein n=1 Tax=Fontibacillus sp. BL9 TaxID=3389971 RepID=UPI003979041F
MRFIKVFFGTLLIILASLFIAVALTMMLTENGIMPGMIGLVLGGSILFGGIKLFKAPKNVANPHPAQNMNGKIPGTGPNPNSFDPFDAKSVNDFVQNQLKQGNTNTVKTSNGSISQMTVTSSSSSNMAADQFNEIFTTFFGEPSGNGKETPAAKEPISLDCPGCGSKTTVHPQTTTTCEFCGTVVPYKEK